ncbi:hypothetical protein ACFORH_43060 [Amycolatopsis roodepoortensis]|uniref:Uncharacterized protein n=1 Tax=Amycolatopsis roodepoortensis TaxID=700274 RepID=A0ABR9LII3_9PSEU|nr:hypothetical protein [Amycolatopsis roodepoortensis]MBE1580479.1 hypothetical protein [Amycolatopsis roodepoortensis]
MSAPATDSVDLGALQHDVLASAVNKQLLVHCHTIAFNSGMDPVGISARITRLKAEISEKFDVLVHLQDAMRAT